MSDAVLDLLRTVPLFSACTSTQLVQVGRLSEQLDVAAGEVLVRQGDVGREVYLIADGEVRVDVDGREVAVLGPGEFFGELALLDPAPRNATVTALTPLRVVLLGQREFSGLLQDVPGVAARLLQGMARRMRELEAAASGDPMRPPPTA